MALTKLQERYLDRWLQNGHSWTDKTQPDLNDDDYAYLDEDDCDDDDPRYEDMRCFPEDYQYDD